MKRREFLEKALLATGGFIILRSKLQDDVVPQNTLANNPRINICAIGDVTLGYFFNELYERIKKEKGAEEALKYPFSEVATHFLNSDITIANLEGALTNSKVERPKGKGTRIFHFRGSPSYVLSLRKAGIEVVNLANNHFMDYGKKGALDTINALEIAGILYVGGGKDKEDASKYKLIKRKGITLALLGYTIAGREAPATKNAPGINPYNEKEAVNKIREAKDSSDLVVVSIHWGYEMHTKQSREQEKAAKTMIDSGADLILGHHPHVLQPIEWYKKSLIFYSLGNFAFGGNFYPADRNSIIGNIEAEKSGIKNFSIIPIITHPASFEIKPVINYDSSNLESILRKTNLPESQLE
jgi:poly-gamma-glutamate synthesis protein (capsule biosynthesis protein)